MQEFLIEDDLIYRKLVSKTDRRGKLNKGHYVAWNVPVIVSVGTNLNSVNTKWWFVLWRFTTRRRNFSLRRENDPSKLKTQAGNTWERHLSTLLWTWAEYRCVCMRCHVINHWARKGENRAKQTTANLTITAEWAERRQNVVPEGVYKTQTENYSSWSRK